MIDLDALSYVASGPVEAASISRFVLEAESARAAVEDFVVDNGPDRTITEVAREVMTRAGWRLAP